MFPPQGDILQPSERRRKKEDLKNPPIPKKIKRKRNKMYKGSEWSGEDAEYPRPPCGKGAGGFRRVAVGVSRG